MDSCTTFYHVMSGITYLIPAMFCAYLTTLLFCPFSVYVGDV